MSTLDRELSRRKFLTFMAVGAAVVAVGGAEFAALENRDRLDRPTDEQKKAKQKIEGLEASLGLPALEVTGDRVGGELKAYFRDRPRVASDKDDLRAGNVEGSLRIGSNITKWIAVVGNDNVSSMDREQTDRWVAFMRGDRAYFAHKSLFDDLSAIQSAPLVDLSKV